MLEILGNRNSFIDQLIAELRDVDIQRDSMRFRKNLEILGEIFGYEISKKLDYIDKEVQTSFGNTTVPVLKEFPVLITILRAGLPLHQGLLNIFNRSQNGFISAFRKYNKDEEFTSKIEYVSCPDIANRTIIISDPILATGNTIVEAIKQLEDCGVPSQIHIATVICSEESIENIKKNFSRKQLTLWTVAVDDELTAKAYLVPGLGDAGDLAFGDKQ